MNRTLALRVEILARRRFYLRKQLAFRGHDGESSAWLVKEMDALDWVLRVLDRLDREGALEHES
jgi:hypothetical protein